MISTLRGEEVLALARSSLGLPTAAAGAALIDVELLAALTRRIAGAHCPCSPTTLRAVLLQTLEGIVPNTNDLGERVDDVLEALHAGGDLLELARVTTMDERTRGTWVFAAPPSFVVLPSGTVRVFGLAPEEALPLPNGLRARARPIGAGRVLEPMAGEDLRYVLVDAGLREQSIEGWLRIPRVVSAGEFCQTVDSRLSASGRSGGIEQLRIFDSARAIRRYADKWVPPSTQSGRYVGRRNQAYGADLWCYVEVTDGGPQRIVDFPVPGSAYRGCDDAWRMQLALDKESGHPQEYQLRVHRDHSVLDLYFPLPVWAQRRLEVIGTRVAPSQSLMSFALPPEAVDGECQFLEDVLWLRRTAG